MAIKTLFVTSQIFDLINSNTDIVSNGLTFKDAMLTAGYKFTSNGFVPNGGNPCATTPASVAVDKQDLPMDTWGNIVTYALTTINGGTNSIWTQFLTVSFLGFGALKTDFYTNFWNVTNRGAGNFVGFRFAPLVPSIVSSVSNDIWAGSITAGATTFVSYFPSIFAGKTVTGTFYDNIGAGLVSHQTTIAADGKATFDLTIPAVVGGQYYNIGYGFTAGDTFFAASIYNCLSGNISAKTLGFVGNIVSSGISPLIGA